MKTQKSIDVCLIGHDIQPSMAFTALVPELASRGKRVLLAVMNGKEYAGLEPSVIRASDYVLIGMSSSEAWSKVEIEAAKFAMDNEIQYGFYSDIFYGYRRKWFTPFRSKASHVFVLNQTEVNNAKNLFPNALVIPSGNPTHAGYFTFQVSRSEVEEKLNIGPQDYVVLVSGTKFLDITTAMIQAVVHSCRNIPNTRIILGLHPSDSSSVDVYNDLGLPIAVVTKKVMSGSHILCRADLFVESSGSLGIEAACKRVPVVNFITPRAYDLIEQEIGERQWPTCVHGTSLLAEDSSSLTRIFEGRDFEELIAKQKQIYPDPVPGSNPRSLKVMADTICERL